MNEITRQPRGRIYILTVLLLLLTAIGAQARIPGITGQSFVLTAKAGHISTGEGNNVFIWGYANGTGTVQYPGPTMMVAQNLEVRVTLKNTLHVPVSIDFPGQTVSIDPADPGVPGLLTHEAPPGGSVTYLFTPTTPGTYLYQSGTRPELQIDMGLVGALIVRPGLFDSVAPTAYGDARSAYDFEYLFLLSEMDHTIHQLVELGQIDDVDLREHFRYYWFINGRNAPDTMSPPFALHLPTQPYNIMPRLRPGDRILLRFIGAGRDAHPFHTHANNFDIIARDGRLLESTPGAQIAGQLGVLPDLSVSNFTQTVEPGATFDAIFTWTGANLGWDIYGTNDPANPGYNPHDCIDAAPLDGFDDTTWEYCADHDKPFPVILPAVNDLVFGAFYSGSPFMGAADFLPPGEGGNNRNLGFVFMWHSHNEKEMTNNDIFPGGMMTMMIVEPPTVDDIR